METAKQLVQQQFGATAERYITSALHAHGGDLAQMVALAAPNGSERVLDVATGGGHTALAFAPHVREVIATDLTIPMLMAAAQFIRQQKAANVQFARADAEALPFAAASFDFVTVRIAPHHFPEPTAFVSEVARVLRPGGSFIFNDNIVPEDANLAAFINRAEQWRDPSHVRCLSINEWKTLMKIAGLTVRMVELLPNKRHDYAEWTARMNMPADEQAALAAWLIAAPTEAQATFEVSVENGQIRSLCSHTAIIVASR